MSVEVAVPVEVVPEAGASLELRFTNVSALHRRFFSDPELVAPLAEAVAACADAPVPLVITYDGETREGHVVLDLSREALRCAPERRGELVDVSALLPLTKAVARYRNEVGASKDMRVYAFEAGLFVRDGIGWASLWAFGQEPADGSTVHPCVGLDGLERCTEAAPHEGVTAFRLPQRWLGNRLATALTRGAPLGSGLGEP